VKTAISGPTRDQVSYAFETAVVTEKSPIRCQSPLNLGYRQNVKPFEGVHRENGVYRSTRSGEAFKYDYTTQSIEPVQDVRLERSGRGR
jgi:hypothetical protein